MSQDVRYRVRLMAAASDGDSGTVETERIDYYDSGIWVTVGSGRDFYPYERIAVIEERPAAAFEAGDEPSAGGEAGDEPSAGDEPPAGGEAGDEPSTEREAGDEAVAEGETGGPEASDEGPFGDDGD